MNTEDIKLDREEVRNIIEDLERIPIAYSEIKDLHLYFVDKLDQIDYNYVETTKEFSIKKVNLGLVPPNDLFDS